MIPSQFIQTCICFPFSVMQDFRCMTVLLVQFRPFWALLPVKKIRGDTLCFLDHISKHLLSCCSILIYLQVKVMRSSSLNACFVTHSCLIAEKWWQIIFVVRTIAVMSVHLHCPFAEFREEKVFRLCAVFKESIRLLIRLHVCWNNPSFQKLNHNSYLFSVYKFLPFLLSTLKALLFFKYQMDFYSTKL